MKPEQKRRGSSVIPMVTVTSKAFKTGNANKTAPYWRAAFNRAFIEKYMPGDPKIKRISIYVGGNGAIFDAKPSRNQDAYELRKGDYFNDEHLVTQIFKHFEIPIKPAPKISTIHLHAKPYKKYDEKMVYELVYINDHNPDTTQLKGIKEKLEADENFPEADEETPVKIKVEG